MSCGQASTPPSSSAGSAISRRRAGWRPSRRGRRAVELVSGRGKHVTTTLRAQSDAIAPPTVTDVSDRRRFEIAVDGAVVGFAEYRRRPGVISFIHTEIDPARNGEGLGTLLVKAALDTARAEGLAVLPYCPFVQGFIDRHREYLDLVPMERRAKFALDDA